MNQNANSAPLVHVHASNPIIQSWTEREVEQLGFSTTRESQAVSVHLVADHPATWALHQLESFPASERTRTVVTTMTSHPVYLDCLASYKVSGVCVSMNEREMLASLYAASIRCQTYHAKSDLTKAELRVVRSLLKGMDADALACYLKVSQKTLNSHLSNVLCKLDYRDRTQLVAKVLGYCPERDGHLLSAA